MKNLEITRQDLVHFIEKSPTPFHVGKTILELLGSLNFTQIDEKDSSNINFNKTYILIKGGATLLFRTKPITPNTRLHIWGGHSDSPTLKIRAQPNRQENQLNFLKTEIYGGPIINTWLDRSFSLAGRVFYREKDKVVEKLLDLKIPLLTIPNAAIHINRELNKGFTLNKEKHLLALFSSHYESLEDFLANELRIKKNDFLAHELQLKPLDSPLLLGKEKNLIHSPRLDNLLMCHAGWEGFLENLKNPKHNDIIPILALFNHEEIGSQSDEGALALFLKKTIDKILEPTNFNEFNKILAKSFFISADVAHAFHPSYPDLYEDKNNIHLNQGIVLKYSSNRHYVSDSQSIALIKNLLINKKINFQESNSHGEISCGTTIGPLINSHLGIKTLDIGSPILAMHSLKELGGLKDHQEMIKLATNFFKTELD